MTKGVVGFSVFLISAVPGGAPLGWVRSKRTGVDSDSVTD